MIYCALAARVASSADVVTCASHSISVALLCGVLGLISIFIDTLRKSLSSTDSCPHSWVGVQVA